MTRVCALANKVNGRHLEMYLALERSLERKGVPFFFFMEGGEWSWERKVIWELEQAATYPDDHFVFIDAYDYLFIGEPAELEWTVRLAPLGFSADSGDVPWPEAGMAADYDIRRPRLSPWCWLNGSGPFGKGSVIAEAAKWGLDNIRWSPAWTDQSFWTRVYLSGYGVLDQSCHMTQALYDNSREDRTTPHLAMKDGRLVNTLTLAKPQFIHATGHSWPVIPKELLP